MTIKKIIKYYKNGSVSVCGMKGRGKDMLQGNVIVRRRLPYVSNIDYGGEYIPYDYDAIDVNNNYRNFNSRQINKYEFPYKDGTDIYLSDCGVYFPSQYCNELNKEYKSLPTFIALSRQLGECSVHTNSQYLGRVWDKIREQSDIYVLCRRCWYIKPLKLVIQKITIYDKYESALERRLPLKIPLPLFANKEMKLNREIKLNEYLSSHGEIKSHWLIYRNKSKYNTRQFKEILKGEALEKDCADS